MYDIFQKNPQSHDNPWLVGGIPTPLWKIWVRQLGWWHSNIWKNKTCSKPPTRYSIYPLVICYSLLLKMAQSKSWIFPLNHIKHGDLKPPTSNPWYFHDIPHLSRIFIPFFTSRGHLLLECLPRPEKLKTFPVMFTDGSVTLLGNKQWKYMADIMVNDG